MTNSRSKTLVNGNLRLRSFCLKKIPGLKVRGGTGCGGEEAHSQLSKCANPQDDLIPTNP